MCTWSQEAITYFVSGIPRQSLGVQQPTAKARLGRPRNAAVADDLEAALSWRRNALISKNRHGVQTERLETVIEGFYEERRICTDYYGLRLSRNSYVVVKLLN